MRGYISSPKDALNMGPADVLRLLSVDVVRDGPRVRYNLVFGDGPFTDIRITVDVPEGYDGSLRRVLLGAAGVDVEEDVKRRLVRTSTRAGRAGDRLLGV